MKYYKLMSVLFATFSVMSFAASLLFVTFAETRHAAFSLVLVICFAVGSGMYGELAKPKNWVNPRW